MHRRNETIENTHLRLNRKKTEQEVASLKLRLVNFDISWSTDRIDIGDEKGSANRAANKRPLSLAIVRIYWRKLGSVDGISLLR